MATADIRAKRVELEYQSVRGVQDDILDRVDGYEGALLGLTEAVSENRRNIEENRSFLLENRSMLRAIIEHLEVPYKRPQIGFMKDEPSNGQD